MNYEPLKQTKCSGEKCPLKNSCGRATSIEISDYEGMFVKPPFKKRKGKFTCDSFLGDRAEMLLQQYKSLINPKQ